MKLTHLKNLLLATVLASTSAATMGAAATPQEKLVAARQAGLSVLQGASFALGTLINAYDLGLLTNPATQVLHQRAIFLTSEWLRADFTTNPEGWRYAIGVAKSLFDQNIAVSSSIYYKADADYCADGRFAYSWVLHPEWGVHGCRVVTDVKGPLCRIDVINHEFFHLVGVNHGEAGGTPVPTDFYARTMYHALDSADHLSGLATSLMTVSGNAVSCNSNGV